MGFPGSRAAWRALVALSTAALFVGFAPVSAPAAENRRVEKTFFFDYTDVEPPDDVRAWYWRPQRDILIEPPPPPEGLPHPSVGQRLPNPHPPGNTLPVAVQFSCDEELGCGIDHERMSAIKFDLEGRGVTENSEIKRLAFTIPEGIDNEQPQYRTDEAKIMACRIEEFFPNGEAEEWKTRPAFSQSDCTDGKREAKGDTALWTFDLTDLAKEWGEDPFSNHGVMLLADVPANPGPTDTWQVNLKLPRRDDPATPEDEFEETRKRVEVDLVFVRGEEEETELEDDPIDTTSATDFTSASTDYSFDTGTTTDTTFPTVTSSPLPTPAATAEAVAQPAPVATEAPGPRLPPYVWLLLPIGLLALAAVRSAVVEPAGGARPDGAIAAIRSRNAARRGGPLREVRDPLARSWQLAARGVAGATRKITSAARSVLKR